jgi:hypothetical protein
MEGSIAQQRLTDLQLAVARATDEAEKNLLDGNYDRQLILEELLTQLAWALRPSR